MNSEEIQKNEIGINNAQQAVNIASKEFNTIQIEINETRIKAIEKLAYFSSGTIALSITFIGSLLSDNFLKVLQGLFFCIPLIYFLFLSWTLLILTVIASIIIRFWNASHLLHNRGYYWASSNKKLKEKMLEHLETGAPILFLDADTSVQAKEQMEESRVNYTNLEKEFESKKDFYLLLTNWLKKISIFSFIFGLIFLLAFAIIVTSRIISR